MDDYFDEDFHSIAQTHRWSVYCVCNSDYKCDESDHHEHQPRNEENEWAYLKM